MRDEPNRVDRLLHSHWARVKIRTQWLSEKYSILRDLAGFLRRSGRRGAIHVKWKTPDTTAEAGLKIACGEVGQDRGDGRQND